MGFMTKDAQVRVDETIDAVVARFPGGERVAGKTFITTWLNNVTGNSQAAVKTISEEMTMTDVRNAGDKAERAKRRALILLESLRGVPVPVAKQTVAGLAGGVLDGRIDALVDKLRIEVSETTGDGMLIRDIFLTGLKATPMNFLQNNRLKSGAIGGGAKAFFFYEYAKDQFKIDPTRPAQMLRAYEFDTISVPAVAWNAVPGRTSNKTAGSFAAVAVTELTGAEVMISTMFSGCAFCFRVAGGRLYAAHIMPDDQAGNAISGADLARQLAGTVGTVAGGAFTGVYGAGWSNLPAPNNGGYPVRAMADQYMNIFASQIGGTWQIYSQQINGNHVVVNQLY